MHHFTDAEGVTWEFSLHFGLLPIIKQQTGVRLSLIERPLILEADEPDCPWHQVPGVSRLYDDIELTYAIMYVMLEDQIKHHGMTPEEFPRRLAKQGVQLAAFKAFWQELINFFRSAQKEQIAVMAEKYLEVLCAAIKDFEVDMDAKANSMRKSVSENSESGNTPDTSELTQDHLPCVNLTG